MKAVAPTAVVSRVELARPAVDKKPFPEVKLKVKRKDKTEEKGQEKKKKPKKEKKEEAKSGVAGGLGLVAYGSDEGSDGETEG